MATVEAAREAWAKRGGRLRLDRSGDPVFVIRKQVGGVRYEVTTPARTLEEALAEHALFMRDPVAYEARVRARAVPEKRPIYLDVDLARDFLAWNRDAKGNSKAWLREQQRYLAWWAEKLKGVDLRRASYPDHIKPPLEGESARRPRGAVLLGLYKWLRQERDLGLAEDPVHGRLTFGEPTPEQVYRCKAVSKEHFDLALEHLGPRWRDLLIVQAGTGWHVTETYRFAKDGKVEPLPVNAKVDGSAGVLVCPLTKGGEVLRTRVSSRVLESGERVRAAGSFSKERYVDAVKAACTAAGIPEFTPGQMRHTVATWAVNAGDDIRAVSHFLGHRSPKTTRRFYSVYGSAQKIATIT